MKVKIKDWKLSSAFANIMKLNKGIRARLFLFFVVMGAIPFVMLAIISARNTINELETAVKMNGSLRNTIISEHISSLIEINQHVLRSP